MASPAVQLPQVLPPAKASEVAEVGGQAEQALALAQALTVDSPEGESEATEWLGMFAQSLKKAEALRLEIVGPVKKWAAGWDERFRKITRPYSEARKVIEGKLRDYRARVREEQLRRQQELEEAARLKREAEEAALNGFGGPVSEVAAKEEAAASEMLLEAQAAAQAVPEVASTLVGSTGAAQTSMHWTFEVVDASKVPPAYCKPDEKLIREAVRAGVREMPGVRIYQEERFAVRTW